MAADLLLLASSWAPPFIEVPLTFCFLLVTTLVKCIFLIITSVIWLAGVVLWLFSPFIIVYLVYRWIRRR